MTVSNFPFRPVERPVQGDAHHHLHPRGNPAGNTARANGVFSPAPTMTSGGGNDPALPGSQVIGATNASAMPPPGYSDDDAPFRAFFNAHQTHVLPAHRPILNMRGGIGSTYNALNPLAGDLQDPTAFSGTLTGATSTRPLGLQSARSPLPPNRTRPFNNHIVIPPSPIQTGGGVYRPMGQGTHLARRNSTTENPNGTLHSPGAVEMVARGFSPAYAGDPRVPANMSANIPDSLNCSVFIVNLPASLTVHRLIIAIHNMGPLGRIFAIHINGPEPRHPGCAAKVVFFTRDASHRFMDLCDTYGFYVDGQLARVMWNRIKTAENPRLIESDASRVLLIGGPGSFVNPRALTDFFRSKLDFQVDEIMTRVDGGLASMSVVEYRFGSFRCQAQAAKMALQREFPSIRCYFYRDPLEPGCFNPLEYHRFPNAFARV